MERDNRAAFVYRLSVFVGTSWSEYQDTDEAQTPLRGGYWIAVTICALCDPLKVPFTSYRNPGLEEHCLMSAYSL